MRILVLDNYDSFTYNLVQYIEEVTNYSVSVFKNDVISLAAIADYDAIVLSPGPGLPKDAGIMLQLIRQYYQHKPILGVCLGHQAIGESFGSKLRNLKQVYHGVASPMRVVYDKALLFQDMETTFDAGRYHSWVIDKNTLSKDFIITAVDGNNEIMAMQHRHLCIHSVQFHPESIMTPFGKKMLINFFQSVTSHL